MNPTDGTITPQRRSAVSGRATVVRIRNPGFPSYELTDGSHTMAELGRYSFLNTFFGRGQRIRLPDGTAWRISAIGAAGSLCPIVTDAQRLRVAESASRFRTYSIHGRGYTYVLRPEERRTFARAQHWTLTRMDDEIARFTFRPRHVVAIEPVPLAAVLLGFALVEFGIPGEDAPRLPPMSWG